MNASEFANGIECRECGRFFYDKLVLDKSAPARMKQYRWVSKWKALAGHIMSSYDHHNKKWAHEYLLGAGVGTGLMGDDSKGKPLGYTDAGGW